MLRFCIRWFNNRAGANVDVFYIVVVVVFNERRNSRGVMMVYDTSEFLYFQKGASITDGIYEAHGFEFSGAPGLFAFA